MTKFAGRIKQALWHPFDASHYLKLFCPWDLGDTVNCSCPTRPMQRQAAFVSMFKIYLCVLVMQSVTLKAEGADMCFHHCIKVFARRFTDKKTSSEQSEQANHISSVRQACGVFVEFKTCTLTCTASLELAALEDAFEGFNFMCFERKSRFLKHATCLEDKDNQISGLCKNEIKLIELAMGTMKHMMFATSKELELSLQNLCRNTTRLVRCFLPAINAICGVDAADLMREFILLTFGKKNALYPMDNADLPGDKDFCAIRYSQGPVCD
uniref:Chondroitin proteoglycan 4 domain-containing protein n=1 Tax=Trichuris muris TaxID=70415 RepID=A0A5S6QES5_TRIMR